MKSRSASAALARNELRELLPLWIVSVVGLGSVGVSEVFTPAALFGLPGAVLGLLVPIALGAMAMGHEYRHGTMTSLLSLPIGRGRILAVKVAVLCSLLGVVGAVAWWSGARTPWLWLPLACGLCLAPWFTLVSRNEVAGMVFAGAVPALLLLAGEVAAEYTYGPALDMKEAAGLLRNQLLAVGTAVTCVLAFVDTARRFVSLQHFDGVSRPFMRSSAPRTTGMPARHVSPVYVALLKKELRLQTMPVVIASALGGLWLGLSMLPVEADRYGAITRIMVVLQPLFVVLLAILSGALASAEERHRGTWPSQVLLPISVWRQWAVKVAVVLSLAFVAGVVSGAVTAGVPFGRGLWRVSQLSIPVAIVAAAVSLHVSSLSQRGITAFLVACAVMAVVVSGSIFFLEVFRRDFYFLQRFVLRPSIVAWNVSQSTGAFGAFALSAISFVTTLTLIAKYSLDNHRRLSTPSGTIVRQVVAVALVGVLALAAREVARGFRQEVMWHNIVNVKKRGTLSE